jgi:hypothetical protein
MSLATQQKRPSTSIHEKKRVGNHQKQTKHFMKAYWPYLPLFGLAGILIIVVGTRVLGTPGTVIGSASLVLAGASFLI